MTIARFIIIPITVVLTFSASLLTAELTEKNYDEVKQLIQPQEGEGLWRHVDWQTDLVAARRMAAEQGKPLLIWAGGGSAPLGGC